MCIKRDFPPPEGTTMRNALIRVLLAQAAALVLSAPAAAEDEGGVVYYQVTYEKGQVRDLNDPPKDANGIRLVVRIARFEGEGPGYKVLATGSVVLTDVNPGRTVMTNLKWNGKAWVTGQDAAKPAKAPQTAPASQPTTSPSESPAGTEKPGTPTGQIKTSETCPLDKGASGIVQPVQQRRILPHRVQVWKLPAGQGERTYCLAMQHAEAGELGAFQYVAYADTDGDGLPDKLIACSPLAAAETPGQWSTWTFTTSEGTVFVGNAWPNECASVYCLKAEPSEKNWSGLSSDVFVSGLWGGLPKHRFRPYLSNIRVRVEQPDPDAGGGSVIIVK